MDELSDSYLFPTNIILKRRLTIMTKKDLAFIRRIIGRPESTSVVKTVSCYVDINRDDIRFQEPQVFLTLDESELDQYCAFFKKGVSGKLGSSAIEVKVEENLLEPLRDTELKNMERIENVAMNIRDHYLADENYSIFFAYGAFDLPGSNGGDSEEVYTFVLALIQPCGLSKPGIKYDSPQNEFKNRLTEPMLGAPTYTFLYPALDNLHTDIEHAVFYSKNEKAASRAADLIPVLFGANFPLSPKEQREGFQELLDSAYKDNVPFDSVNSIFEHFQETLIDMQMTGEDVSISGKELADAIIEYGDVPEERQEELKQAAEAYEGQNFSVNNIISDSININARDILIKTKLESLASIERRNINGKDYFLIPANNATINDIVLANSSTEK